MVNTAVNLSNKALEKSALCRQMSSKSLLTGSFYLSGFESILEGFYGPLLLKDLHLFNGGWVIGLLQFIKCHIF